VVVSAKRNKSTGMRSSHSRQHPSSAPPSHLYQLDRISFRYKERHADISAFGNQLNIKISLTHKEHGDIRIYNKQKSYAETGLKRNERNYYNELGKLTSYLSHRSVGVSDS